MPIYKSASQNTPVQRNGIHFTKLKEMPRPKIYFIMILRALFSYLGSTQIEDVAQRYGLGSEYKPHFVGRFCFEVLEHRWYLYLP